MNLIHHASLLLLAPILAAQTQVAPALLARAEGNNYDYQPFGDTRTPFRYLQVHDDMAGHAMTIHGMSLRREGLAVTTPNEAYTVLVDVFLSTAATTAGTVNAAFDNNHGTNRAQVASFLQVNFPATVTGSIPRPFEYRIPFPQSFAFDGNGGLCWEVRIQARTNTSTCYFDTHGGSANPPMAIANLGSGCKAAGRTTAMTIAGSSSMQWQQSTGNIAFNCYNTPPSMAGILATGTSNTSFSGIPLPFEIPGTRGTPSGTCFLYNSFAFLLPALSNASGMMSLTLGVPATPEFYGGRLFAQAIYPDATANTIGFVTTDQVQFNWVPPYASVPVGRVVLGGATTATGSAQNRMGLVVQFD